MRVDVSHYLFLSALWYLLLIINIVEMLIGIVLISDAIISVIEIIHSQTFNL